jgi:hypothetical protein
MSEVKRERREQLLHDLAVEGSSRCCYAPGCMSAEAWVTSRCDCKFRPTWWDATSQTRNWEQTGCCEVRTLYRLIEGEMERA